MLRKRSVGLTMRSPLTLYLCDRKRSAKQPYRVSILNSQECRTGTSPTAHSDFRKRMSYQGTSHHRPRTSPITIPNKDLHRTIRHPVVIANRKRSRHSKRPNNCIRFVRAAKSKATGLTGRQRMLECRGSIVVDHVYSRVPRQ